MLKFGARESAVNFLRRRLCAAAENRFCLLLNDIKYVSTKRKRSRRLAPFSAQNVGADIIRPKSLPFGEGGFAARQRRMRFFRPANASRRFLRRGQGPLSAKVASLAVRVAILPHLRRTLFAVSPTGRAHRLRPALP